MNRRNLSTIYIVSGGDGSSGEHLLRTALAQFEGAEPAIVVDPVRLRGYRTIRMA
jgi:hypothetical protein